MVVLAHSVLGYGAPESLAPLQLGGIGVDLFFVLSGWLLGGQLFKEMKNGKIDIKRFWIRRWMRTLPAYYVILSLTLFQQLVTKDDPNMRWDYYFFLQNYNPPLDIFYVSWSLAVEEHFYLFIAPMLALIAPIPRSWKMLFFMILIFLPSIFRFFGLYDEKIETHVRIDGCVFGVFAAYLYYDFNSIWKSLVKYSGVLFLVSIFMFFLYFIQRWFPMSWIGDPSILALSSIFVTWVIFANSNNIIKYNFYFPGAYHIATRSYSLYLLHPEAIALINRVPIEFYFPVYVVLVLALSLFLSEFLYRFVELTFMNLRSRFSVSAEKLVARDRG
jgi:peptidoglycan/LPS O-acetylase OafA/YrhL